MTKAKASTMKPRLRDLKGLGPKSERVLPLVGITTVEQLEASDPFDIYARLKMRAPGTSLNALYALIGAIEGRHWQEVKRERRTEILLRLEEMGLAPE
jgi:DNA transformation protein